VESALTTGVSGSVTVIARQAARVRYHALRVLLKTCTRTAHIPAVRLGTAYGGWWVPNSVLNMGGVAYCGGAGEDISFDLALHDAGWTVVTCDPTPRAIEHVQSVAPMSDDFTFVPVGWWDKDETLRFYAPSDPTHVSHSILNLQKTTDFFSAEVGRVRDIARRLGHERIDLMKMDIEGAEFRVIDDLLTDGPLPTALLVEFDQPSPTLKTIRTIRRLRRQYHVAKIDRFNFTFLLRGA
jgi:FkbM family methyltransferase